MGEGEEGQRSHLRLPGVGGFLADRVTDVVDLLGFLPDIGASLRAINQHVTNLDNEVVLMRTGVNKLESEVAAMRVEITALRAEMSSVSTEVELMSGHLVHMRPHVEALGRLASPFSRGRRRGRDTEPDDVLELTP